MSQETPLTWIVEYASKMVWEEAIKTGSKLWMSIFEALLANSEIFSSDLSADVQQRMDFAKVTYAVCVTGNSSRPVTIVKQETFEALAAAIPVFERISPTASKTAGSTYEKCLIEMKIQAILNCHRAELLTLPERCKRFETMLKQLFPPQNKNQREIDARQSLVHVLQCMRDKSMDSNNFIRTHTYASFVRLMNGFLKEIYAAFPPTRVEMLIEQRDVAKPTSSAGPSAPHAGLNTALAAAEAAAKPSTQPRISRAVDLHGVPNVVLSQKAAKNVFIKRLNMSAEDWTAVTSGTHVSAKPPVLVAEEGDDAAPRKRQRPAKPATEKLEEDDGHDDDKDADAGRHVQNQSAQSNVSNATNQSSEEEPSSAANKSQKRVVAPVKPVSKVPEKRPLQPTTGVSSRSNMGVKASPTKPAIIQVTNSSVTKSTIKALEKSSLALKSAGREDPLKDIVNAEGFASTHLPLTKRPHQQAPEVEDEIEDSEDDDDMSGSIVSWQDDDDDFHTTAPPAKKKKTATAIVPLNTTMPASPRIAKRRIPWTTEETNALVGAVAKYGFGNWAVILANCSSVFSKNKRTAVNLKDRWRILEKAEN